MEWLSANWGNLLVVAVLLAIVVGIITSLVKRKRNGGSCGCGCCDCTSGSCIHKKS